MKKENIDKKLEETYWKGLIPTITLLFVMIVYLGFQNFDHSKQEIAEEPIFFCGNSTNKYSENYDLGKALFKANCASCHNKNMKTDMTGPALGGVEERWEDKKLLYQFIRNSQAVIKSGDAYAVNLYEKYDKTQMTAFPSLTDEEIEGILKYISFMYDF